METKITWLQMDDGMDVYVKSWTTLEKEPMAILQISHGMAEHIERYDEFASFLVQEGIFVYGNDQRGHGNTAEKMGIHGYFAEENGFERVVNDLYVINKWIKTAHPNIPIFLMGHSMGSFLARRYIQKYPETINGVILSGTGSNPGIAGKIGKQLAKWEIKHKGAKTKSPLLDRLSFGAFNKGIEQAKTKFDWLSRDSANVEKYIEDPLCGFVCSSGLFYDLFTGFELIHDDKLIQQIPKELPMLIFSGLNDPVGGKGQGVKKVLQQYKKNGLKNIHSIFFEDGRHEMLNEINKEEVFEAVFTWLKQELS